MGNRKLFVTSALTAMFAAFACVPIARAEDMTWSPVNNSRMYAINVTGKVWSAEGATVTISSKPGVTSPFGGLMGSFDATKYIGKDITLTAVAGASDGASNAILWIRTDGPTADAHLFRTTEKQYPVHDGEAPLRRGVRLTIPRDAKTVVIGALLSGTGTAHFEHFRVSSSEATAGEVDAPSLLDESVALIRTHALAADSVDWTSFLKEAHAHLSPGDPASKAYPDIESAIKRLNDGHSFFMNAGWATARSLNDGRNVASEVKVLQGGIGYVLLPAFSGPSDAQRDYVEAIAGAMESQVRSVKHGWVVDLRQDTGGDVPTMLAAVRALLGKDAVGAYRAPERDDYAVYAGRGMAFTPGPTIDLSGIPVAVLLGPRTSSAGEMVAIAFHGRPRTRSFGLPTSGQASANAPFPLKDGSRLALKTAIDVDRHGEPFGHEVTPDQRTNGDAIEPAIAWLSSQHL